MALQAEMERVAREETSLTYGRLMRACGLRFVDPHDESTVVAPLLELMQAQRLDFHGTFRTLSSFRPRVLREAEREGEGGETACDAFIRWLVEFAAPGKGTKEWERKRAEWRVWLEVYAARLGRAKERVLWAGDGADADAGGELDLCADLDAERERAMQRVNPRFVLRQWVLEDVIARAEADVDGGRKALAKVMQ
ncbi:hypothetical protein C0992_004001, partial [Termitomyces sp. T32_za158]